jgi:hypothetical protein
LPCRYDGAGFCEECKGNGVRYRDSIPTKADAFNDYIEQVLKRPQFNTENFDILVGFDTIDFEKPGKKPSSAKKEKQQREAKRRLVEAQYKTFSERYENGNPSGSRVSTRSKMPTQGFEFLLNAALNEADYLRV